jgi:hypothetical protein
VIVVDASAVVDALTLAPESGVLRKLLAAHELRHMMPWRTSTPGPSKDGPFRPSCECAHSAFVTT